MGNWSDPNLDMVEANPDKEWDWKTLSLNPNIMFVVKTNPDKEWDWGILSSNLNLTMDVVKANPDKSWNWYGLSSNPNLTIDVVKANPIMGLEVSNTRCYNRHYYDQPYPIMGLESHIFQP